MMLLIALAAANVAASPAPDRTEIVARTERFLEAYARDDVDQVVSMTDPNNLTVYGSDAAEYCEGAACLKQTMADDFALWRTARFGEPSQISVRGDGHFATIFFNVPLSIGGRPSLPIRVSMVWRKSHGEWLLTQTSNVVPTQGSSAAEILRPAHQH